MREMETLQGTIEDKINRFLVEKFIIYVYVISFIACSEPLLCSFTWQILIAFFLNNPTLK